MKVTDEGVPVAELISAVKDSISQAGLYRASQPGDLRVGSVQLILQVVASKSVGGGLNLMVPFIGMKLSVGGKVTRKDTHTVDVTLMPPAAAAERPARGGDVQDALVNAITTIRDVMKSAADGDDPWTLSAGAVDISFVITKTGSISLGADGELTSELTHTLHLSIASGPE
jgi:hypothetical protein